MVVMRGMVIEGWKSTLSIVYYRRYHSTQIVAVPRFGIRIYWLSVSPRLLD